MRKLHKVSDILIPLFKNYNEAKNWTFSEYEVNPNIGKRNFLILPPQLVEDRKNVDYELFCYLNSYDKTDDILSLFHIFDGFNVPILETKDKKYYIFCDVQTIEFQQMNTNNRANDSIHKILVNISITEKEKK